MPHENRDAPTLVMFFINKMSMLQTCNDMIKDVTRVIAYLPCNVQAIKTDDVKQFIRQLARATQICNVTIAKTKEFVGYIAPRENTFKISVTRPTELNANTSNNGI